MIHPLYMNDVDFNVDPDTPIYTGFGYANAAKGMVDSFEYSASTICILLSGEVLISGDDIEPMTITGGSMAVFPPHLHHVATVLEDARVVFLYVIGENSAFCESILTPESCEDVPEDDHMLHALPVKPILTQFAEQVATYITDRKFSQDISYIKQQELMVLLSTYYTQEELRHLLMPLYRSCRSFYGKVMSMGYEFKAIDEMASELHMSRSTFIRRFKETFDDTPQSWLIKLRTNLLYNFLTFSELSLAEVSFKLKFSSQQRMSTFCKERLGGTPMEIRSGEVKVRRL